MPPDCLKEKMDMIAHEAVMVKLERMIRLNVPQNLKVGSRVGFIMKDIHAVVSAGDQVEDSFFRYDSGASWHG